jgi:hypothetical protein
MADSLDSFTNIDQVTTEGTAPREKVDVQHLLGQIGISKVLGVDSPGIVRVEAPKEGGQGTEEVQLDVNDLLKRSGADPSKLELQYSSPEKPVLESNLSFGDKVDLSKIDSLKDRAKYLTTMFGADNVRYSPQHKEFVVQKDGIWALAKDNTWNNFFSDMAGRQADSLLASGALGAAGAAAGSIVPVVGTVVGGMLGAGVGAVIGKMATIEQAKNLGLRTDDDFHAMKKELVSDFILGAAGEAAGKAVTSAIGKIASAAAPEAKEMWANILSMGYNLVKDDSRQWLNNWREVAGFQKQALDHEVALAANKTDRPSPLLEKAGDLFQSYYDRVRAATVGEEGFFKKFMGENQDNLDKMRIDGQGVYNSAKQYLQGLNLIDDGGRWVASPNKATGFEPRALSLIKRTWSQIVDATGGDLKELPKGAPEGLLDLGGRTPGKQMTFEEARVLRKSVDALIDSGNLFGSANQISGEGAVPIQQLRVQISNAMQESASKIDPEFGKNLSEMNARYHSLRQNLDVLSPAVDKAQRGTVMQRIFDPSKNDPMADAFFKTADAMGDSQYASELARQIKNIRAGMNTTAMFSENGGGAYQAAKRLLTVAPGTSTFLQPRKAVPFLAKALDFAGNPANFLNAAAKSPEMNTAQFVGLKALAGIAQVGQTVGKPLMNNPEALGRLIQMYGETQQTYQGTRDAINQHILQQTGQ